MMLTLQRPRPTVCPACGTPWKLTNDLRLPGVKALSVWCEGAGCGFIALVTPNRSRVAP